MPLATTLPDDGSRIDIGRRSLFLRRRGTGAPVVLLEAGMGGTTEDWAAVYPAIAQFTEVCCYDRAGLGLSDPAPTPRTAADFVDDLHLLLCNAQIQPPYILVAHSMSGMHVRLFASRYPDDVAGLVLVDATHEEKYAAFTPVLSPELQTRFDTVLDDPTRNSEQVHLRACIEQLRSHRRPLSCPVSILARGRKDEPSPVWPTADLQMIEIDCMKKFADEAPHSTFQIAAHSGHHIPRDQPELVILAIQDLVMAARQRIESERV